MTNEVTVQSDDAAPIEITAEPDSVTIIVVPDQGPQGVKGDKGDKGDTGLPGATGPMGPQGIQGIQGATGADGNTVLYGPADPVAAQGVSGNFYINTTTHFMFGPKAAGAWPAGTSLVGPQGPIGPQGIPGNTVLYGAGAPAAGTGVDGNFYIDTAANFIYGPKAAGAWPAGTSMIGPQGIQGEQGIQGPVGPTGPVPEAPTDGKLYGRQNSGWAEAASFPSGTVMLFWQAAAPTGWTKLTTQNDKALRVVSGAGGVAGGTNAFSTVMAQTVVGSFTPDVTHMAAHAHTGNNSDGGSIQATAGGAYPDPAYAGTGSTGGGAAHNHTILMAIQYIDIILASKN